MANRNSKIPTQVVSILLVLSVAFPAFGHSSVETKQQLDLALPDIDAEAEKNRRMLAGLMTVSGVFYGILATATPVIGNEYTQARTPLLFGILGAGLLAGGIYVFSSPSLAENKIHKYRNLEETRIEDIDFKATQGSTSLKQIRDRAHLQRLLSSLGLMVAGAIHVYASTDLKNEQPSQIKDSRGYLFASGLAKSTLGFAGMLYEKKMSGAFGVFAFGMSDLVTEATSRTAPSTDYLVWTGGAQILLGLTHIIFPTLTEKKFSEIQSLQQPEVSFGFSSEGAIAQLQWAF